MQLLYTATEIRTAIGRVLQNPESGERRVVMVAFVGAAGHSYLPDPSGIELVCWLRPGATDAVALRRLQGKGVSLYKVDHLHTKIYWSSTKGCVIGSANLSETALGGHKQFEAGVLLPAGAVDIDHLLRTVKPTPVKESDLVRLKRQTDLLPRAARAPDVDEDSPPVDFVEWYESRSPKSQDWKWGWWSERGLEIAKVVRKRLEKDYDGKDADDAQMFAQRQVVRGDWILCFRLPKGTEPNWMFIDFALKVDETDKRVYNPDYPVQAVEVDSRERTRIPPFQITAGFKKALRRAVKHYGEERITNRKSLIPPAEWLKLVREEMRRIEAGES